MMLIACLCAEWCSACRAYRSVFEDVAGMHSGSRFLWVDIEDAAELCEGLEFEVFPAVLIAQADRPVFFGPVAPQRDVLARLIAERSDASIGAVSRELAELLRRLQTIASGDGAVMGIERVAGRRSEEAT